MGNDPNWFGYADVVGQSVVVGRLREFGGFYKKAGTIPGHILIVGDEGMGKSWIARAFTNESGLSFRWSNGSFKKLVGRPSDRLRDLSYLRSNSVSYIITNINLVRKTDLKTLASAVRAGVFPLIVGDGKKAGIHKVAPYTLIATCPRKRDCPSDLIEEFSLILEMQPYSLAELAGIAELIASRQNLVLSPDAAQLLLRHCERRPRSVGAIFSRLAKAVNKPSISEDDVRQFLTVMGVESAPSAPPEISAVLAGLSGAEFESVIVGLLSRMGFRAEMTKSSGDGGIDIIASLDKPIVGGKYLFQCKRYSFDNSVGVSPVRDFYGAVTADRAVKGVFITTSSFTQNARDFAQKSGVELIDMTQLKRLLAESEISDGIR